MLTMFDSHAHYYDARFERETEAGAGGILDALFESGTLAGIVNVGTNPETSAAAVRQAAGYTGMYAAVGIHPEDCMALSDPETALGQLRTMLGTPGTRKRDKIVAIGEIGLDYHWEPLDKQKQAYFFDRQLTLAAELGLPVIIHDRDAHGDCFETVLRHRDVTGVFHSYSGSAEMARELVRHGWYLSFSGVVTFRNASRVQEVAASVPPDRILVETDCPYLAPHPYRGQINHSGLMRFTVEALAELHRMSAEDMARLTADNARRLFGI